MPSRRRPPASGSAAVLLPPFTIHVGAEGHEPIKIGRGKEIFRIYWPHVDAGGAGPQLRQANLKALPYMTGVDRPSTLPRAETRGIERNWKLPSRITDALRIDCYPDSAIESANVIGDQFFRQVRLHTRQWWVTRDRRFEEPIHRNSISVDSRGGHPKKGYIHGTASNIGLIGYERLLDGPRFEEVCADVERELGVPFFWDLLLDAHYYHAVQDTRMCLLQAAMACENVVRHRVLVGECGREGRPFLAKWNPSSLGKNLTRLKHFGGDFFKDERPRAHEVLVKTWSARHDVAHGKEVTDGLRFDPSDPTAGATRALVVRAVLSLFFWLGVANIPTGATVAE